jgi:amidohydrolase
MLRSIPWIAVVGCVASPALAQDPALDALVDRDLPALVSTYKALHAAPELSHHEQKTSALVARELRALGFEVTERVGKYPKPELTGYGVVAVMKNGPGPTVLVRADMDGLPVEEKTGLAYASTVRAKNDAGQEVPVMHACGHDVHVTALVGTAKALVALKDRWKGTLLLVGQPAEEMIDGAKAMLADGLYARFPKPTVAIALHDNAEYEAGKIVLVPGYAGASSTGVEVVMRGQGGHGSRPEATKDPIVLAAQFVLALQTIVSRENRPFDPAVVSVGAIHGGTKSNIIPDEVTLLLTIRTYKDEVRQRILASIERMARGLAAAAGVPEDRAPSVTVMESTPALYNDPELTRRLTGVFEKAFGKENVAEGQPVMGSEDFGLFGLEDRTIPVVQFGVGAADAAKLADSMRTGTPLPSLHSSLFAPAPEPTLRAAVKALTAAVLDVMKP